MDEGELREFGRTFQRFLMMVNTLGADDEDEPLRTTLTEHLGRDPRQLPVVSDRFAPFEHVNAQVALEALLEQPRRTHRLVGLLGDQHVYMSFAEMVQSSAHRGLSLGAVGYLSLADGFDSVRPCVQAGLYLLDDDGTPVAILLRGSTEHSPHQRITVEVLAAEREHGERLVAELRRLSVERSVFRSQVLTLEPGPLGDQTAGPVVFQGRPTLSADDVILPEHTFAAIDNHVFGIAEHRERLLASGQHIKRGLLLHGPPGTGKTLTTRYLIGRLVDHTVVVLSGPALRHIRAAASLARSLQPALVVIEDVDLVANERNPETGDGSPLLFELLNVMDGLDEDADLTFLLTTNRADVLEPALAARPGRVDLAVEIALPDDDGRRRLLELYGAAVDMRLRDMPEAVARTEGVTASFIKELVRKAALVAARNDGGSGRLTVTDETLGVALDEMLEEGAGLTRALLGVAREGGPDADWSEDVPPAAQWFAHAPQGTWSMARPVDWD